MIHIQIKATDMPRLEGGAREQFEQQIFQLDERIQECEFEANGLCIGLTNRSDIAELRSKILGMANALHASFKFFKNDVIREEEGGCHHREDPRPMLFENGDIVETVTGANVLSGTFLKLRNAIDRELEAMIHRSDVTDFACPTTVPANSLLRAGYLNSHPHQAIFAASLHADSDTYALFGTHSDNNPLLDEDLTADGRYLSTPQQILSPTVCYHCFEALSQAPEQSTHWSIQNSSYTSSSYCHRHEGKTFDKLARLQTFFMREMIFVGDETYVEDTRQAWMAQVGDLFASWGLKFRIALATDPFFAIGAEKKRAYQSMFKLKYECLAYLPYSRSWLAVGSFNNHQATLTKSFGLHDRDGCHSGCWGVGIDRLLLALFSQFGPELSAWPEPLRKFLSQNEMSPMAEELRNRRLMMSF